MDSGQFRELRRTLELAKALPNGILLWRSIWRTQKSWALLASTEPSILSVVGLSEQQQLQLLEVWTLQSLTLRYLKTLLLKP